MTGYTSGMIGFPLRLLAREIYDKIVNKIGSHKVALSKDKPSGIFNTKEFPGIYIYSENAPNRWGESLDDLNPKTVHL